MPKRYIDILFIFFAENIQKAFLGIKLLYETFEPTKNSHTQKTLTLPHVLVMQARSLLNRNVQNWQG